MYGVYQGTLRTHPSWHRWNVLDDIGTVAGFVVKWTRGYMAYGPNGEQLTNAATLDDAIALVASPPALVPASDIAYTVTVGE